MGVHPRSLVDEQSDFLLSFFQPVFSGCLHDQFDFIIILFMLSNNTSTLPFSKLVLDTYAQYIKYVSLLPLHLLLFRN